jgi:hypothetical protein
VRRGTEPDTLPVAKQPTCDCAKELAAEMGAKGYFAASSILEYSFEYYCQVSARAKGEVGPSVFLGRTQPNFCPICAKEWK